MSRFDIPEDYFRSEMAGRTLERLLHQAENRADRLEAVREMLSAENNDFRNKRAKDEQTIKALRFSNDALRKLARLKQDVIVEQRERIQSLERQLLAVARGEREKQWPDPELMNSLRAATITASEPKPSPTAAHLYRGGGMGIGANGRTTKRAQEAAASIRARTTQPPRLIDSATPTSPEQPQSEV